MRFLENRIVRIVGILVLLLVGYLLFWPVPIRPYAWTPGPDPGQTGPYVANDDLARAHLVPVGVVPDDMAPETIARSPLDGRLYTALANGWVVRLPVDRGTAERVVWVGSRPLGVTFGADGTLYVAHTRRGVLAISPDWQRVRSIAGCGKKKRYPGYTDSLYLAADGSIWFTCPSQRFDLDHVRLDGMETRPTGKVRQYDPRTGKTKTVLRDLMFANGITMGPNEDFVLVNEWARYRVTRYWVAGPRAGTREVFIDNLPGYPDNIHRDATGLYWVGLVIRRNPLLDRLHSHPFLMKILPRLPAALQPFPPRFGWLLALDAGGHVVYNLQDATGGSDQVTGARRVGDTLYVTSNDMTAVPTLPVPPRMFP
jgi:sugar lactone lactonase YvrE